MPGKAKTPAPIDRPLSRAYLREFSGWSTAYPPGISEPTSLRIMENVQVMRDGALRIRPGLRAACVPTGSPTFLAFIGTHEPFFLNSGDKAYLQAVREIDGTIGFRVLADTGSGMVMYELDDPVAGFTIVGTTSSLNFTAATTYVKYLQIDNKIFALSNAGETMRYFTVGTSKVAKRLNSIERPAWAVSDKLTVVQPTQAWINSGVPIATRTNFINNPQLEVDTIHWGGTFGLFGGTYTSIERTNAQARVGGAYSLKTGTVPFRINYMTQPLGNPAPSLGTWALGGNTNAIPGVTFTLVGGRARVTLTSPAGLSAGVRYYVNSPPLMPIERLRPQDGAFPALYWLQYDFHTNLAGGTYTAELMTRFFNSSGVQVGGDYNSGTFSNSGAHIKAYVGTVPFGAVYFQVFPNVLPNSPIAAGAGTYWEIDNVFMLADPEATSWFDGDTGADYFWEGTVNNSRSYHHPGQPALVEYAGSGSTGIAVSAGLDYTASVYVRAATTPRTWELILDWQDAGGSSIGTDTSGPVADVNTSWATRLSVTATAPTGATNCIIRMNSTADVERGEYHYLDQLMVEQSAVLGAFFDGSFTDTSTVIYAWTGTPNDSDSTEVTYSAPTAVPGPATATANTLIDSTAADNVYNFGFFYTFSNEVGESAASQVTVVKAQRGWSQWRWELANAAAEPNGTHTDDPNLCADELVAYMPSAVFADALDQGATKWHLYMLTWSDQDPVPVQAVKLGTRTIAPGNAHGSYGYQRMTPQQADANAEVANLPSEVNRFNFSTPSSAGQGIVAADRMVMVFDPASAGVIRWSSNEMGYYSDFSSVRGGGFKTLSSGNLFVPASVVLWQNPQSADTITILCMGVDGRSTGYYMQPAQVASQSEAVNIMGFEETTATPGTTSPYGCEVVNNALYHPLDEMLMKSTATNYNINHSPLTDPIQNVWRGLLNKEHIVSAVLDNRIYYLVHNPEGEALEPGCWGNEVWVFDAAQKAGSWSRWLVQGASLRRFEQHTKACMSIVRPEGLYFFDDDYALDDFLNLVPELDSRSIPWQFETNTQGANRAHDAMAHLQQVSIIVGNFQGALRYGVRGLDMHGRMIVREKNTLDDYPLPTDGTTFDLQDFLLVRRDMSEWFFFASSVTDEDDIVLPSAGQISLVQYRYTPVTVNVGYEWGDVETFEYQRSGNSAAERNIVNGVPMPFIDTGRP